MPFDPNEIIETIHMTEVEHLDIRTVSLGVSLRDCAHQEASKLASNIREKLLRTGENHVKTVETVSNEFGIPIANKRLAVSPIAIIADEAAIGVVNKKTTAVRIIPVPGKMVGQSVEYGGLLGTAPIMPVSKFPSQRFVLRGGRIPAPLTGLNN